MKGYLPMTADLFHVGHLNAIRQAKKKCDILVIGLIDSPEYKETIIPWEERFEILMALPEVDAVVAQTSITPELGLGIDILFSGDGFEKEEVIEAQKRGVILEDIDYYQAQSTTKIKEKIWKKKKQ